MKILVTGGAGYIGSILVPALMSRGHYVTVLDNFMYGQSSLNHLCSDHHLDVVVGDARDARNLEPLLASTEIFIPLAAIVGAPACDKNHGAAWSTNVAALETAFNYLSKEQRVIIPISNSGYGVGEEGIECTESSPLRPISLYGRSKVQAEEVVLRHENAISLRLATVFGMSPRMRLDLLVNDFVYRALNDRTVVLFEPHFKRNYIHVRDVSSVFEYALSNFHTMRAGAAARVPHGVFNVGLSSANLSKRQLCERIKLQIPEFTFVEAEVGEDPDKRDYVVSNAKIEGHGWHPKYSLDDGIAELIKGLPMLRNRVYGNV